MQLSTQLKRGYFALAVLTALGIAGIMTPEFAAVQKQAFLPVSASNAACKANAVSRWKLASTPIDIQPLLLRKALICRA